MPTNPKARKRRSSTLYREAEPIDQVPTTPGPRLRLHGPSAPATPSNSAGPRLRLTAPSPHRQSSLGSLYPHSLKDSSQPPAPPSTYQSDRPPPPVPQASNETLSATDNDIYSATREGLQTRRSTAAKVTIQEQQELARKILGVIPATPSRSTASSTASWDVVPSTPSRGSIFDTSRSQSQSIWLRRESDSELSTTQDYFNSVPPRQSSTKPDDAFEGVTREPERPWIQEQRSDGEPSHPNINISQSKTDCARHTPPAPNVVATTGAGSATTTEADIEPDVKAIEYIDYKIHIKLSIPRSGKNAPVEIAICV